MKPVIRGDSGKILSSRLGSAASAFAKPVFKHKRNRMSVLSANIPLVFFYCRENSAYFCKTIIVSMTLIVGKRSVQEVFNKFCRFLIIDN